MTLPNNIQTIFQKEISRKEFLGILTLGITSVLGFGHIIQLLTGKSLNNHPSLKGYSSGGYGGAQHSTDRKVA